MNYEKIKKRKIKDKFRIVLTNYQLNSFYNFIKKNNLEELKKINLNEYCQKNKSHALLLAINNKNIDIIKLLIPYSNLQLNNLELLKTAIETNDNNIIDLVIKNTKKLHKAFNYTIKFENKFSFDKIIYLIEKNSKEEDTAFINSVNCSDRYFFDQMLKRNKTLLKRNLKECIVESFKNKDNPIRNDLLKLQSIEKLDNRKLNLILNYLIKRNDEKEIINLLKLIKNVEFYTIRDALIKNGNVNVFKCIPFLHNTIINNSMEFEANKFLKDSFEYLIRNKRYEDFCDLLDYTKNSKMPINTNYLIIISTLLKDDIKTKEKFIDYYLKNANIKGNDILDFNFIYKSNKKLIYKKMFEYKNIVIQYFKINSNIKLINYDELLNEIIKENKTNYIYKEIKNMDLKNIEFDNFKNNLLKLIIEDELKEEMVNSKNKNKRKI